MATGQARRIRADKRTDDIRGEYTIVPVPGTHRDETKQRYGKQAGARRGTKTRLGKADRQKLLLDSRRRGMSWREAAKVAGYRSVGAAFAAGQEAIADIPREAADEIRSIELSRLDEIVRANWSRMLIGDPDASNVILRAIDRRAKMLGLDLAEPPQGIALDVRVQALLIELISMPDTEFTLHESEIEALIDASQRGADRARRTAGAIATGE